MEIKDEYFICKKLSQIVFPESRKYHHPVIIMLDENSKARALVRHIRNGIAHGKTAISKEKDELYIEIKDYGKSLDNHGGKQPTYIFRSHISTNCTICMPKLKRHGLKTALKRNLPGKVGLLDSITWVLTPSSK